MRRIKIYLLLNIIYSAFLHENDTQIKNLYKYLLARSFTPFFDMIKLWICHGFLENEHDFQEFMIFSPKSYIKEKLNDYYRELFWETKYILSENNIPSFLQKIANKILFIGKSYNIEFRMQKIPTHRFQKSPGLSSGHSALRHNAAA